MDKATILNYLKPTLFLLFFSSLHLLTAQTATEEDLPLISTKHLQEDFQLLKTGLEKTHAGLYTYTSKDTLDKALKKIEASLNQPMTSINFFRKISPLLKLIGNGHTTFFVPSDYNKAINATLPRFPFAVYWHQDTLYVLRNLSANENIQPGTIIKSINGESASDIMQDLADNLTRDGYNDSWPKGRVGNDFSGKYAYFKGIFPVFDIELIDKKGQIQALKIKGLTTKRILESAKKRYPNWRKPTTPPLQFSLKDGIAHLTVKSFNLPTLRKAKQQYKAFFKKAFQQIKNQKSQHLIIDLRDNGGGQPKVVNELFSYLIDQPYTHQTTAFTITKNLPNQNHYKYGFWEVLDMRKSLKLKKEATIFRVTGGQKYNTVAPSSINFSGKIYVLANPFTFSGGTDFMGMLKSINRGVFIGEIAGGSPHHATAWLMPSLILPNSRIEAIIPLVSMKTVNKFLDDGLGITPDFFVKNNIEEELEKKDVVLDFTLKKIKAND